MSETLALTKELIACASVTPADAGCQQLIVDRLAPLGFSARWLPYEDVSNLLITHGSGSPSLFFLGHTDVVPPGPEQQWTSPPFQPEERDGVLYGRGACDMKGAVAAMVTAMAEYVTDNPDHPGQLGLLLTSDEEGPAINGIRRVAGALRDGAGVPDYCLVGEPSSQDRLGDTVRIGRRGSIAATLQVNGVQGHTAFPHSIDNPVHRLAPFLAELTSRQWDDGVDDEHGQFPPSHCQVSNINAGTGATNVTPADVQLTISFRYNTEWSSESLKAELEAMLARHKIGDYTLEWWVSGEPFRSTAGPLRGALVAAIEEQLGLTPALNTGGGTSDGRFIAPLGAEVVELGLINASIHKIDENVPLDDLDALHRVYGAVIEKVLR